MSFPILKYVLHPSRLVKAVEWMAIKREFNDIKENSKIGLNFSIIGPQNITLGKNFSGGDNISLWTWESYDGRKRNIKPDLRIGDNVTITNNCIISCAKKIEIGDGTLLGRGTFITDNSHGKNDTIPELNVIPAKRKIYSKGEILVGKNVWTGANVCIMPGVTIGNGVVIGANSVVTHDLPDYCIAAGVPARIIKRIESDLII